MAGAKRNNNQLKAACRRCHAAAKLPPLRPQCRRASAAAAKLPAAAELPPLPLRCRCHRCGRAAAKLLLPPSYRRCHHCGRTAAKLLIMLLFFFMMKPHNY